MRSGRCLGVFDTVGSIGLPEELRMDHKMKSLFGFPDKYLGAHVEYAFHAMALDERRSDFVSIYLCHHQKRLTECHTRM